MPAVSAPERKETVERTEQRSRGLTIAVAMLAVIAVILGGWLAYELQRTDETALTPEVQAVMDDYFAAWNAYDVEAFSAVVTSDYLFYQNLGRTVRTAEETALWMTDVLAGYEFGVEAIGPYQMVGDEQSAQVTSTDRYLSRGGSQSDTGTSMYWLVNDGGAWRIQTHFVGD